MFKKKSRFTNFIKGLPCSKPKALLQGGLTVLISVLIIFTVVQAGNLTPSAEPDSTMKTLQEVYDYITTRSSHSASDVWGVAARTLTSFGTLVGDIWDKATSELTTAGSIGKLLVENINATISSRAPAATALLNTTWTDDRAVKIDNLDAAVSSRSSHSAADVWAVGARTITGGSLTTPADYKADVSGLALDSEIGNADDAPAMNTTLFAGQQYILDNMGGLDPAIWTNVKAEYLDAAVSSRSSHSAADVWTSGTRTLTGPRGPVIAMSARSASTYTHANAAKYCYDLSAAAEKAMDGDTSTTYTDWRLPTVGEATVFEGTVTAADYIWTATIYEATVSNWIRLRLSDGGWGSVACSDTSYVRCVR